jgi:hypothetical protein
VEKLQISVQLMNAIIGYLGSKPYQETHQLIAAIQEEAKTQPAQTPAAE